MDIVRFAVAGCGFIGNLHARVIQSIPNAQVIATMDTCTKRAQELAEKYECSWYDNAEEMLNNPHIDVVSICLPSGLHWELTVKAAKAGKHVICEKPIDICLESAQKMVDACRQHRVQLGVIMQHRFDEPVLLLKKAIENGWFGKLLWGASRTIWYRDDQYYSNPWRGTWKYDGGGALMNQSIHYIDLLLSIMGNPKSISGKCRTLGHSQIETEDIGLADIEFESGALGTIEGTTVSYPGLYAELSIFGEKGSAIIRNDYLTFYQFQDGKKAEFETLLNPEAANHLNTSPAIKDDSHRKQYEDFIQAVLLNQDPAVTGEEAMKSLHLIQAIYESSQKKCEIYL